MRRAGVSALLLLPVLALADRTDAAPRMISFGYANCASCHVSPQGRGLLDEYGAGIDDSQSFTMLGTEPAPWSIRRFDWDGRLIQDLRALGVAGKLEGDDAGGRLEYRNSTAITERQRVTFTIGGEGPAVDEKEVSDYYASPSRQNFVVNRAIWQFRVRDGLEIQVGRDHLPTPVNVTDRNLFVRSRNRWSSTDWQTQAKLFFWDEKHQAQLFVWGPDLNQKGRHREYGGGALGEIDVGEGNAVLGLIALAATSDALDRQVAGAYARLGLTSKTGLLLEHDVTHRSLGSGSKPPLTRGSNPSFFQFATFAQMFWTPLEWMLWKLTFEHLNVQSPFSEDTFRGGVGVSLRWTRHLTTTLGATQRFDPDATRVTFGVALKM